MKLFTQFKLTLIALTFFASSPSIVVAQDDATHALDGNSYVVEVLKTGDTLFANENIEFENGKFESTFMEDKGYKKSEYSTTKHENELHWTTTIKNSAGDTLTWNGSESAGKVQGTITLASAKNDITTWSFKSAPR